MKRSIARLSLVFAVAVGLSAAACSAADDGTGGRSSSTSSSSSGQPVSSGLVTGTYDTTYVTGSGKTLTTKMSFTQTGQSVTGEYIPSADPEGRVEATMAGALLDGEWVQGAARGPLRLQFTSDGSSFTGTWDYSGGPGTYSWKGTRLSTTPTKMFGPSTSGGTSGGCHSDSDCHDKCKRCVLSSGSCVSKTC